MIVEAATPVSMGGGVICAMNVVGQLAKYISN